MRSNVVIPVIAVGLIVAGAWVFLRSSGKAPSPTPVSTLERAGELRLGATDSTEPKSKDSVSVAAIGNIPAGTTNTDTGTTHEAYVAARVAELGELAMQDDSASLES